MRFFSRIFSSSSSRVITMFYVAVLLVALLFSIKFWNKLYISHRSCTLNRDLISTFNWIIDRCKSRHRRWVSWRRVVDRSQRIRSLEIEEKTRQTRGRTRSGT